MIKIAFALFFIFSLHLFAFDAEQFTSKIADNIGVNLYNVEPEEANKYIELILEKNKKSIKAFQLIDSIDDSIIYQVYQNDGLYVQDKDIPSFVFEQYQKISKQIIYEGVDVGKLIVYYDDISLKFTKEERKWIKNNPIIKVSNENDWPPFDFAENGIAKGYSVDIIKALADKIGIEVKFVNGYTWSELLTLFDEDKLDVVHSLPKTDERKKKYSFSDPYMNWQLSYFIRTNETSIKSVRDFDGKKIGAITGWATTTVLKKRHPKATVLEYTSVSQMMTALSLGKVDAGIDDRASGTYISVKELLTNIKFAGPINLSDNESEDKNYLYFMANNKNQTLLSILNKALSAFSTEKRIFLQRKWFGEAFSKPESRIKVDLTKEEREWIQTHTVKIGVEDWAPAIFLNTDNDIDGFSGDFTKEIIKRTGLKVEIIGGEWNQLLEDFKDKKIDLLPDAYKTKNREKFGNFSDPYFKIKDALFIQEYNYMVHSLQDLEGKTLALVKGFAKIESIQKKYPKIKIVQTENLTDSINRVLDGRVVAFLDGQLVTDTKIQEDLIKGLKSVVVKEFKVSSLHYFSNIDEPLLASILQKALKSISYQERREIISKWVKSNNLLKLTKAELAWIDQKNSSVKYVFDPDWKPFEWKDSLGHHQGILSDVIKLIEYKSGLNLEAVSSNTWAEAIDKVKSTGEQNKAQMFSGVGETKERKEYLNFTDKPLYSVPYVFVSKKGLTFLDGFESIKNKKIVTLQDSTIEILLKENKPNLKLHTVSTLKNAFNAISDDSMDVLIVSGTIAKYYINTLGYKDLYIAYKTDFNLNLKIALRKDTPKVVLDIINKSIDSLSEKEIADIVYKWTQAKVQNKTDWILIFEIMGVVFIFFSVGVYWNYKLKSLVKEKTAEMAILLDEFDANIIASKTDLHGRITHVSKAFCDICQYSEEELLGKPHSIVRHPDVPKEAFVDLWKTLQAGNTWRGEVKNLKKDGGFYWVDATIFPEFDKNGKIKGYSAIRHDITAQKEVENLTENLEIKIEERTKELHSQKEFTQTLLDSQEQLIITTNGKELLTANETFYDFFAVDTVEEFMESCHAKCVCDTFNTDAPEGYLQIMMERETWIDYVISHSFDHNHKAMISMGSIDFIFSVTAAKLPGSDGIKSAVFTNITEMENAKIAMERAKTEIEEIHKHTRESIEYASLIQGALIPDNKAFRNYFQDYFAIWHPKDTIGGDIYLFEELRDKNECLLMVIDCTGHGVPGAFVTMLVKAIERQITSKINHNPDEVVSPAKILSIFNKNMKQLLKQEDIDSISNAGFDGGIIYYNKKDKIIKFAGAETPLFYVEDNELKMIKGNRYSVGYKKCTMDYEYKEHTIEVKEGMQFYLTTDGYLDQNGGEKSFPFGKKAFKKIIEEYHNETMADQQEIFLNKLDEYQGNEETNDDVTLVGFKI